MIPIKTRRFGLATLLSYCSVVYSPSAHSAPSEGPVFDVPRLANIVIDGRADDWGTAGFALNTLTDAGGKLRPADDFDATVRLGWGEKGLLVLARVRDDEPTAAKDDELWQVDSLELFMASARGATDVLQVLVAPGTNAPQPDSRSKVATHYKSFDLQAIKPSAMTAVAHTPDFHVVEALLPWANLQITPSVGREIGFQIYINDADGNERVQSLWYPEGGANTDSRKMQRLRLALKAGAPVDVVASGNYERSRRTRVNIVTTGEMVGRTVELREKERVLGRAQLVGAKGLPQPGRATAEIVLPMPAVGQTYGPIDVVINRKAQTQLLLPDARAKRRLAFLDEPLLVQPAIFNGDTFPPLAFEQPSLVEDLIGEYTINTTFYDRGYNAVKTPTQPGRYGAIAEISGADGTKYKRFLTLYRQPENIDWRKLSLPAPTVLPPGWGVDATVIKEQSRVLGNEFKWMLQDAAYRGQGMAALVAGLAETKPGDSTVRRKDVWSRDRDWWYGLKKKTGDLLPYRHLLQLPAGYEADPQKKWPVLLFLHGSGESGSDLERVKVHGPPRLVSEGKQLPFIVVSPQCEIRGRWSPLQLNDLLDDVAARYRVDASRIYVTGLSLGGYGTWDVAMAYPEKFAAIAPICGGGDPPFASLLKNVPSWIFHGAKDEAVAVEEAYKMADALKQVGAEVKLTVYPNAGHDSWTESYNNPQFYEWLLQHSK